MPKRLTVLFAGTPGGQGATVRRILGRIGCSVIITKPDEDLLRLARRSPPDLILLGTVRGSPGRRALCRLLKNDPRAASIPLVALLDARPTSQQWREVGLADEVIRRATPPREIATRIRTLLRLGRLTKEARRTLRLVREQARVDDLTGLATHGAFQERIEREFQRASRYRRPLSVLMADVDHFKRYNDSFGHPAGDRLLRLVGRMIAGVLRRVDFGARYGGDEFSVILPETSKSAAGVVAERIRTAIETHPFPHRQSQPLARVTVSIGVATHPEDARAVEKLVEAADRALYQAKSDGRNLVRGIPPVLTVARGSSPP